MGVLFIIITVIGVIIYLVKAKYDEMDHEQEMTRIANKPTIPDFVYKVPETGQMRMNFQFDPSETDIGEYLILDAETTGLPKVRDPKPEELNYMPRIVQISWMLLDLSFKCVNSETCYLKQDAPIPKEAIKIHKITDAIIAEKGEDPKSVFERLHLDIRKTKYIIAHNIDFDIPIIESEFIRLGIKKPFRGKKKYCTMKKGATLCKIPLYSGSGYKYPKLEELFEHCYFPGRGNVQIDDTHNAEVDVALTAKCFIKLKELGYFKIELSEN